jgi:CheY-like chemotaxis protein
VKKKIAIIDDHVLIAQAIKGIISNFTNFEVLFECENGKEFTSAISRKKQVPDIVLLDISMPIMNGFETAKWLQEHHPEVMIMVLSMQTDEESINKMIKNGARSYLLKNVHPSATNQFLIPESQWFSPYYNEIGNAFKDVFENYKNYTEGAKRQAYRSKNEFSWDKMKDKVDSLFTQYIPEFPKAIELKLPQLKKIELPKLKKI